MKNPIKIQMDGVLKCLSAHQSIQWWAVAKICSDELTANEVRKVA